MRGKISCKIPIRRERKKCEERGLNLLRFGGVAGFRDVILKSHYHLNEAIKLVKFSLGIYNVRLRNQTQSCTGR